MTRSSKSQKATRPTVRASRGAPPPRPGRLWILAIADEAFVSHPLPETGAIVIGRAPRCDVRLDDPSISRRHAVVHLGPSLMIEDVGSSNGTRLGKQTLAPNQPVALAVGDVVDVGNAMVIVQERTQPLRVRRSRAAPADPPAIVLGDSAMQHLHRLVERIAGGTISVLILGETGVGKEVLAETIHRLSPRAAMPFVRLNCAALAETLLESELFGHERGAFTGAVQAKPGLLETAHGGTVFLDELGEMPLSTQVKLLRVFEARQVLRVGALKPRPIDVRFVAATHRDLEAEIARGRFRSDLYFRLNGIALVVPPLRQRVSEIEGLAGEFIRQFAVQTGRPAPTLSPSALAVMQQYGWPGNIRELRNVVERAVLLCPSESIGPEHLPVEKMGATSIVLTAAPAAAAVVTPGAATGDSIRREMEGLERQRLVGALAEHAGNQTATAKALGVSRRTLVNRLRAYKIPRPQRP